MNEPHILHVYCADIGAMRNSGGKNNFGWASRWVDRNEKAPSWCQGTDMSELAKHIAADLNQGSKVALGFECPLWIPVRNRPEKLTKARAGEPRAWSAGAGTGSLATGLAQVSWILQAIHRETPEVGAFLDWDAYQQTDRGLLIWEAFVSVKDEETSHVQDAMAAVSAFVKAIKSPSPQSEITEPPKSQTRSLIGAALLWAGWSDDANLLRQSCLVIKA